LPHGIYDTTGYDAMLCFAWSGQRLVLGTYFHGVFFSTDDGSTWTPSASGLTPALVNALTVSGTDLFAGADGGAFRSTDDGTTWSAAWTGLTNPPVMSLAASGSHLFAGTYGGVFLSTDSGAHWTGTGLSPAWVNSLRLTDGNLFAGTDRGVFVSTDLGTTWNAASVGLTATFVFSLGISGGSLFVGTNSGAWGRPLQEMFTSIPVPLTAIPSRFSLQQNYPNPFNPSTSIRYSLQVRSHVTLSVFNTLGQLVSTLVNGSEEAGYHDVRFDASGLASGAYFYRLQARDFVQSKKLIVLR
jgi:hypothetical protein